MTFCGGGGGGGSMDTFCNHTINTCDVYCELGIYSQQFRRHLIVTWPAIILFCYFKFVSFGIKRALFVIVTDPFIITRTVQV